MATQPRAAGLTDLQHQLDELRGYHNTARPHRALHRRTPAEAYDARATGPPLIDGHFRVRHDRNDRNDTDGTLALRHDSRLQDIGSGRATQHTHLVLVPTHTSGTSPAPDDSSAT